MKKLIVSLLMGFLFAGCSLTNSEYIKKLENKDKALFSLLEKANTIIKVNKKSKRYEEWKSSLFTRETISAKKLSSCYDIIGISDTFNKSQLNNPNFDDFAKYYKCIKEKKGDTFAKEGVNNLESGYNFKSKSKPVIGGIFITRYIVSAPYNSLMQEYLTMIKAIIEIDSNFAEIVIDNHNYLLPYSEASYDADKVMTEEMINSLKKYDIKYEVTSYGRMYLGRKSRQARYNEAMRQADERKWKRWGL